MCECRTERRCPKRETEGPTCPVVTRVAVGHGGRVGEPDGAPLHDGRYLERRRAVVTRRDRGSHRGERHGRGRDRSERHGRGRPRRRSDGRRERGGDPGRRRRRRAGVHLGLALVLVRPDERLPLAGAAELLGRRGGGERGQLVLARIAAAAPARAPAARASARHSLTVLSARRSMHEIVRRRVYRRTRTRGRRRDWRALATTALAGL